MQSYRETKSLLAFRVECPGAQFAEFVTSPLDITHFETTALLYFRELLRQYNDIRSKEFSCLMKISQNLMA